MVVVNTAQIARVLMLGALFALEAATGVADVAAMSTVLNVNATRYSFSISVGREVTAYGLKCWRVASCRERADSLRKR